MLTALLTCLACFTAGVFGALLGARGVNASLKRDLQTTRDDVDHLAGRIDREVKVRAGQRSAEQRGDHLKEAAEIAAAARGQVVVPPQAKLWGRNSR